MKFFKFNKSKFGAPLNSSVRTVPVSAKGNSESKVPDCDPSEMVFWSRDHKLGISTEALIPLYNAAKRAFVPAYQMLKNVYAKKDSFGDEYLSFCSSSAIYLVESEIMKHSKAVLMLSCDFGTAWNSRFILLYMFFYANVFIFFVLFT